ncbi:MAG: MFS transporter [Burkholderiales bacterium]
MARACALSILGSRTRAIPGSQLSQQAWWRWSAIALSCCAFFIAFFHRVSTGSLAGDLQSEFAIGATALGTLGAMYFYVYALMQVPSGVLADTLGPRITLSLGMLIAGIGSIAYGLAASFAAAAIARTLVGVGVSVVFVCMLKLCANWFHERRFATAVGAANVAGITGALAATAPLAWLITVVSWRSVFVAVGVVSLLLALAIWLCVRETPHAASVAPVGGNWRGALAAVAANPATWPPFWVNVGISGSYMTFIGLWAAPFLVHAHGLSPIAAGRCTALTLIAFAFSAPFIGWLSDRLHVRRPLVIAFAVAHSLVGLMWIALPLPSAGTAVMVAVLTGLAVPGFTLTWSIAKEVNPPERAGMAIAIANIGGFVASGLLQPLVGWVVDSGGGMVAGGSAQAYRLGIGVLVVWSLIGIIAAYRLTETRCRNVWHEKAPAGAMR